MNFKLYLGLKHISPYIEDAVKKMHEDGIEEAVTVVLAPHYSSFSVGSYDDRAQEEADKYGMKLTHIKHYYHQPKFIKYWTDQINETLNQIPENEHDETVLVVSAHSLPKGLIERNNDPYQTNYMKLLRYLNKIPISFTWLKVGNLKGILEHLG